MGADPLQAARNVTETERRASEIRILVARGLIADLVTELARLMASRTVTGPEEIRLQDLILKEVRAYALQSGAAVIDYLSPREQARRVDAQSPAIAELAKATRPDSEEVERTADEVERELSGILKPEPPTKEVVPFGLPKTTKAV